MLFANRVLSAHIFKNVKGFLLFRRAHSIRRLLFWATSEMSTISLVQRYYSAYLIMLVLTIHLNILSSRYVFVYRRKHERIG